ncbi:OLC1v1015358C1 [Oldenlandia corymbosa var. corymbosa]|uniref:OLC1v1015358C1 n=1 Tax=Oldenlandia corymbosa var. corymbosa TaxID=529605 RepID=A0AAV1E5C3_OLDCO|nr:OLC1v1015358C1 [Oldenlandia corymbosa var. corymbosa]
MRGVGGPLLCIGDLLSDVGKAPDPHALPLGTHDAHPSHPASHLPNPNLRSLFQENYDKLDKALTRADNSWMSPTLKLCAALEAGNKLVQFGNSQVKLLSEKVEQLEELTKQIDSAVAAAKDTQASSPQLSIDSGNK